jgi:PAS domain S-box-containing protein
LRLLPRALRSRRSAASRVDDERKEAEERSRLWESLLEQSAEGIVICDARQRILLVNAAFERVTGFSSAEILGKTPRRLQSGRQDRDFYASMWRSVAKTGCWSGELCNKRRNGEFYVEALIVKAVYDRAGTLTHYVRIFSDITEKRVIEARAAHLAEYDSLTELPNRALLAKRLEDLADLAGKTHTRFAILHLDRDRFANVNDRWATRLVTSCYRRWRRVSRLPSAGPTPSPIWVATSSSCSFRSCAAPATQR